MQRAFGFGFGFGFGVGLGGDSGLRSGIRRSKCRRSGLIRFGDFGGGFFSLFFFLGLALFRLLLLLLDFFLLFGDQHGAFSGLLFACRNVRGGEQRLRSSWNSLFGGRRGIGPVSLDENAFLAHLDLDRACPAGTVCGLDFGRLLARQRDLLFLLLAAVLLAQVVEQARLVLFG